MTYGNVNVKSNSVGDESSLSIRLSTLRKRFVKCYITVSLFIFERLKFYVVS